MKTRLELAAVTKSFGKRQVLNQAWLQVRAGEAVGLIGANGAGKTTLLRIAAGLVRPDGGLVRWSPLTTTGDEDAGTLRQRAGAASEPCERPAFAPKALRRARARVGESEGRSPSAETRIRYYAGEVTLPPSVSARRWASLFGVATDERRRIGQLSRGSRQIFGLRVLLSENDADLLLLDEPWESLDPEGSAWLTETVRRWRAGGAAVLISSHRLYDLDAVCTRFLLLEGGGCQAVMDRELRPRVDQLAQAVRSRGRA